MNNLMILDLSLLVVFVFFVSLFLYKHKSKIKKDGWLFLYHTKWGINFINRTGTKYKKFLKVASYLSVTLGYLLMAGMIWLFGRMIWLYVANAELMSTVKVPPITPLIPYLPQIFNLSWLPPFYFSYWIIILAIIAITHELFHGIFAKIYGVNTKTTGFGFFPFFFPVFLAAFVNLDEKIMQKKSSFKQRAVLSAGTFANVLTAILGIFLMWGFFSLTYTPAGISYNDYAYNIVNLSDINSINGIPVSWNNQTLNQLEGIALLNITANNVSYYTIKAIDAKNNLGALYYSSPAIKSNLSGAIKEINGEKIDSLEKLGTELSKYSPGDSVELTLYNGTDYKKNISLEGNPFNQSEPWLGVAFISQKSGFMSKVSQFMTAYQSSNVYYQPSSQFAKFIFDLLWWLVLISFSVALVNMLPAGIFDGGRFFYLTIFSITSSKKIALKAFKIVTNILLAALFVIMIFWAKGLFL